MIVGLFKVACCSFGLVFGGMFFIYLLLTQWAFVLGFIVLVVLGGLLGEVIGVPPKKHKIKRIKPDFTYYNFCQLRRKYCNDPLTKRVIKIKRDCFRH